MKKKLLFGTTLPVLGMVLSLAFMPAQSASAATPTERVDRTRCRGEVAVTYIRNRERQVRCVDVNESRRFENVVRICNNFSSNRVRVIFDDRRIRSNDCRSFDREDGRVRVTRDRDRDDRDRDRDDRDRDRDDRDRDRDR